MQTNIYFRNGFQIRKFSREFCSPLSLSPLVLSVDFFLLFYEINHHANLKKAMYAMDMNEPNF